MTFDDRFRTALRSVPETLEPTPGLSDDVLAAARRGNRRGLAGTAVLIAGILLAIPLVLNGMTPSAAPTPTPPGASAGPEFPRPGGGPVAVHLFVSSQRSHLLDETTGNYLSFAFGEAALSPDRRSIAVIGEGGRLGVADRALLLREGESAITWTAAKGGGPQWSPDGLSVLVSDVDKSGREVRSVVRRYTVAGGLTVDTVIPIDIIGQAAWASDSERYLVLPLAAEKAGAVEPGPLRYVAPDGSLGAVLGAEGGGSVVAYSPSGRLLLIDGSQVQSAEPMPSRVIDVATGEVLASFEGRAAGWYDEEHHIRILDGRLEVMAVTGAAARDVPTGDLDLDGATRVEFGPTAGLPTEAADLGF